MAPVRLNLALMTPAQLRRLQMLWHRWMGRRRLPEARDRELRHAYIEIVTRGRVRETKELTGADATLVIRRLERATRRRGAVAFDYVAGTAGRHGYDEHREVSPPPAAWRSLDQAAAALGMAPARLDHFIAAHYAGVGLRRRQDIRTLADLNRVLWGLKALLRRRPLRASLPGKPSPLSRGQSRDAPATRRPRAA